MAKKLTDRLNQDRIALMQVLHHCEPEHTVEEIGLIFGISKAQVSRALDMPVDDTLLDLITYKKVMEEENKELETPTAPTEPVETEEESEEETN